MADDNNLPDAPWAAPATPATTPPAEDTSLPDAPWASAQPTTTPETPHSRYRAVQQGMATESPEKPAGWSEADIAKHEVENPTGAELARKWEDIAVGLPQGLAGAVTGGILGDTESAIRALAAPLTQPQQQFKPVPSGWAPSGPPPPPQPPQQTIFPTSVEGGPVLGQRGLGLNIIPPASSEEEAEGRNIGSMLVPFLPKALRSVSKALDRPVPFAERPPDEPPPPPPPSAPDLSTPRVDARGNKISPDLLPPDTPHVLPAGATAGAQMVSPLADISPETILYANQKAKQAGFTPATMADELASLSPQHFGAEIGRMSGSDTLWRNARGIVVSGGEGGNDLAQAMRQRGIERPERVDNMLTKALGEPENLADLNRITKINQQQTAGPLYEQFRNLKIQPTQELKDLLPFLQQIGVTNKARWFAMMDQKPWLQKFFTTGATKEFPTAESWDYIKQAIDSKIEGSLGPLGQSTQATRRWMSVKGRLLNAIDNHPDSQIGGVWKQARDAYAGPQRVIEARNLGYKLLSDGISPDEVPYMTAGFSQPEMAGVRQGLRSYLKDQLGRSEGAEGRVVKKLLSDNAQTKLRWIMDNDPAADELFKGLDAENDMANSPRQFLQGSHTAEKGFDAAEFKPQPGADWLEHGKTALDLVHKPIRTITGKGAEILRGRIEAAAAARTEKFKSELAKLYGLQGPVRDAVWQWIMDHGEDYARQQSIRARGGRVRERKDGGGIVDQGDSDTSTDDWSQYVNPETGRPRITIGPPNADKTVPGTDALPPTTETPPPTETPPQPSPSEREYQELTGEIPAPAEVAEPTTEKQNVGEKILGLAPGQYAQGPRYQTWPERMVRSAVTAPGEAYGSGVLSVHDEYGNLQGYEPVVDPNTGFASDTAIQRAQDLAGMAGGASVGAGPEEGAAGVFGGKMAKGADLVALKRAQKMSANGTDRGQIWDQTGWFQGKDGMWRFEIPDDNLAVGNRGITHPDVQAAYPNFAKVESTIVKRPDNSRASGSYTPGFDFGPGLRQPSLIVARGDKASLPHVAAHEIQHFIQNQEGFQSGSNLKLAKGDFDRYKRSAGEVEARNAAERLTFSPQERLDTPPWETEDTPRNRQLMSSDSGKPGAALSALEKQPFYSAVERAIQNAPQDKATMDQWAGWLQNQPGIKKEELEQLGFPDKFGYLKGAVPKEEMLRLFGVNKTQLGERWLTSPDQWKAHPAPGMSETQIPNEAATKYERYTMPGEKSNYRELLIKKPGLDFPTSHWPEDPDTLMHLRMSDRLLPDQFGEPVTDPDLRAWIERQGKKPQGLNSLHLEEIQSDVHERGRDLGYEGQVNTELPTSDIIQNKFAPTIDKSLEMEGLDPAKFDYNVKYNHKLGSGFGGGGEGHMYNFEVTPKEPLSEKDFDRFQVAMARFTQFEGRDAQQMIGNRRFTIGDGDDTGAVNIGDPKKPFNNLDPLEVPYDPNANASIWLRTFGGDAPAPNAPFKNTNDWVTLGLKRAITQAAKEGKDAISWSPGSVHNDMYSLSNHVDKVMYNPKAGKLYAWKGNSGKVNEDNVTPEKLPDYIGKEAADRILNNPTRKTQHQHWLEGQDLEVGGEPMKNFYDKMVVNNANKLGKKFGTQVEWKDFGVGRDLDWMSGDKAMEAMSGKSGWQDIPKSDDARSDWFRDLTHERREKLFNDARDVLGSHISIPVLRFTPQLKEQALKGFSLFSDTGKPGAPLSALERTRNRLLNLEDTLHEHLLDRPVPGEDWVHENLLDMDPKTAARLAGAAGLIGAGMAGGVTSVGAEPQRAKGGRVVARNINHKPSGAQKEAGNYKKDHVWIHGLDITIENAKGSTRHGVSKEGKPWRSTLPAHYGYIRGTEGSDGDHVDIFIGPHLRSSKVWIIDQVDPDTKGFDEHKAFLGFGAKQQVLNTYYKAFSDGKGKARVGTVKEMPIDQFKSWLKNGDTTQPVKKGGVIPTKTGKITRNAFLYLPPKPPKNKFAQCSTCILWTGSGCLVHDKNIKVTGDMTCGVYIPGHPQFNMHGHEKAIFTPEQSGLLNSQVQCQRCLYTSGNTGDEGCGLYRMLNQRQPEDFDLDPKIESEACCNAFRSRS